MIAAGGLGGGSPASFGYAAGWIFTGPTATLAMVAALMPVLAGGIETAADLGVKFTAGAAAPALSEILPGGPAQRGVVAHLAATIEIIPIISAKIECGGTP